LEQKDLIDSVCAHIRRHRDMRNDHQLHQAEVLHMHCVALKTLTKQQQQALAEDLHARHALQKNLAEKDKKHTVDKAALQKQQESDEEWLKKQQDSMSQRSDKQCRDEQDKMEQLHTQQINEDMALFQKLLDSLKEMIQAEHDKIFASVSDALRSNTMTEKTVELPTFTVPAITDIFPDGSQTEDASGMLMSPPAIQAPSAPRPTDMSRSASVSLSVSPPRSTQQQRSASVSKHSKSHSALPPPPADDVPPPPPPEESS